MTLMHTNDADTVALACTVHGDDGLFVSIVTPWFVAAFDMARTLESTGTVGTTDATSLNHIVLGLH